jgi:hypothetical protein
MKVSEGEIPFKGKIISLQEIIKFLYPLWPILLIDTSLQNIQNLKEKNISINQLNTVSNNITQFTDKSIQEF